MESKYLWILGLVLLGLIFLNYSKMYVNPETKFFTGAEFSKYFKVSVGGSPGLEGNLVKLTFTDENIIGAMGTGLVVVDQNGMVVPFVYGQGVPYWVEPSGDGSPLYLWVKVPHVPARGTAVLYISDKDGYPADPESVFTFFEDFSGTELNTDRWECVSGECGVENGYLRVAGTSASNGVLSSYERFGPGVEVGVRLYVNNAAAGLLGYGAGFDLTDRRDTSSPNNVVGTLAWCSVCARYHTKTVVNGTPYVRYLDGYITSPRWVSVHSVWSSNYVNVYMDGRGVALMLPSPGVPLYIHPVTGKYPAYLLADWVFIRDIPSYEPIVSVYRSGSVYRVVLINESGTDLNDVAVKIPAQSVGVTSTSQQLSVLYAGIYNDKDLNVFFDPGYDGSWTEKNFYVLYGTDLNTQVYIDYNLDISSAGGFAVSLYQARDVNLYPGYAHVSITPNSIDPGTYTVTISLTTENPEQPAYAECEWVITDPVTQNVSVVNTSGGFTQFFTYDFTNEGVYTIDYTCHVFLTEDITGTVTKTVVLPNPDVSNLSLETNLPLSLGSSQDVTFYILVSDDSGAPVSGADVYVTLNDSVTYRGLTDENGMVTFTLTLSPGDVLKVSAYKSGYHPVEEEYAVSSAPTGGGGGGVVGGGGAVLPTTPSAQPSPQPSSSVQPAAPTTPGPGVSPAVVVGVLVVLAVLYFLSRR